MATWAVVAGGGTAGHVLPGLALCRALVERGHDPSTIHYVGTRHGIESRLVPEAGFSLTLLPGRGLERRLTVANIGAVWGLTRALVAAVVMLVRRHPAVVVALGGYASVPCGLAALMLRIPVVVVEQNAVPGAANRLIARFARAAAVAFPGTDLPRAHVTGNPVRPEVLAVDRGRDRSSAREALGLPQDRHLLAVFGGSLGALRINTAVTGAVNGGWRDRSDLAVRHVVGERDWALVTGSVVAPPPGGLVYSPVPYERRMDLLLVAADLAVCRAGAMTVSELAAVGVPAVLVPLPYAPGDHQTANARVLEQVGGAVLVPDGELDAERLQREVDRLLATPDVLVAMGRAAAGCARRDAVSHVADLVEEHARRG